MKNKIILVGSSSLLPSELEILKKYSAVDFIVVDQLLHEKRQKIFEPEPFVIKAPIPIPPIFIEGKPIKKRKHNNRKKNKRRK